MSNSSQITDILVEAFKSKDLASQSQSQKNRLDSEIKSEYSSALPQSSRNGITNPYVDAQAPKGLSSNELSAWYSDNATRAREWDTQMQLYQFELWYNSEVEKVKRLQQVGINPDLAGLGDASTVSGAPQSVGVAGSSSMDAVSVSQQRELTNRQLELQKNQMIIQTVLNGITSTMSLFSSMSGMYTQYLQQGLLREQITGAKASVESQTLDNFGKIRSTAASILLDNLGANIDADGNIAENALPAAYKQAYSSITGNTSLDKSIRREITAMSKNPKILQEFYRANREALADKSELAKGLASPYYGETLDKMVESYRPLLQLMTDADMSRMKFEKAMNDYSRKMYDALSPELKAAAGNYQDFYNMIYYSALDGNLIAESESTQAISNIAQSLYNTSYYNQLDAGLMASAQQAAAEYKASQDTYNQGLIEWKQKELDDINYHVNSGNPAMFGAGLIGKMLWYLLDSTTGIRLLPISLK